MPLSAWGSVGDHHGRRAANASNFGRVSEGNVGGWVLWVLLCSLGWTDDRGCCPGLRGCARKAQRGYLQREHAVAQSAKPRPNCPHPCKSSGKSAAYAMDGVAQRPDQTSTARQFPNPSKTKTAKMQSGMTAVRTNKLPPPPRPLGRKAPPDMFVVWFRIGPTTAVCQQQQTAV